MTPRRKLQSLQEELAGLKGLLQSAPAEDIATALMQERVTELDAAIATVQERPPLTPEAELFFVDGAAIGSEGLEVTFTSHILDSYQNMVTNHYAAKHYGVLRRSGRRRGEMETKLYLTALPRGSFGLQLSQPHVEDFVAAENLSAAMKDVSGLIESSAESDPAFEAALNTFNPRVLKPLQRFLEHLFNAKGACRVVTGFKETKLSETQIADAYTRVTAAKEREEILEMPGVFGGVLTFSWEFDFKPDAGDLIHGPLAEEVDDETATNWNLHLTHTHTVAKLKVLTVSTRTGNKKPSYELLDLKTSGRLPAANIVEEKGKPSGGVLPPTDEAGPGGANPPSAIEPKS